MAGFRKFGCRPPGRPLGRPAEPWLQYPSSPKGWGVKTQSSSSLAFVRGIHPWPVASPHKRAGNAENISIWWRHHDYRFVVWVKFTYISLPMLLKRQDPDSIKRCHLTSIGNPIVGIRRFYDHNGISHKTTSLYWIGAQNYNSVSLGLLWLCDVIWRFKIWSSSIQVIACHLFGA